MAIPNEQKDIIYIITPLEEAVVHLFQKIAKFSDNLDILLQHYQQALSMLAEFHQELRENPFEFSTADIALLQSKADKLGKKLEVINLLLDTLSKDPVLSKDIAAFYQKDFTTEVAPLLATNPPHETSTEKVIAEVTPKRSGLGLFGKISV